MRQARWTTNRIEVVEAEPDPLAAGMARIQVTGCGICGSDLDDIAEAFTTADDKSNRTVKVTVGMGRT